MVIPSCHWVTAVWKSAPPPVLSCPQLMQNTQACSTIPRWKGIRVDSPPRPLFKNNTPGSSPLPDSKHLMPRKWTVSDLASLGRLNQFAPGNKANDLRLKDSSWKLQCWQKIEYLSPEARTESRPGTSPGVQRIINGYTKPSHEITFSQDTKSTFKLRQMIIRKELEEDGDWRWGRR